MEVVRGTPRRRWRAAEKAAIVAESVAPGAVASAIARRPGRHRNQLCMWRRGLRSGAPGLEFVPVVVERRPACGTGVIEIAIGGAVLRAEGGVDRAFLGKIVRLLKAT